MLAAILLAAAIIAKLTRRKQTRMSWCATKEDKAAFDSRWVRVREDARMRLRATPNDSSRNRSLKVATGQLKRERAQGVHVFISEHIRRLERRIREGDQFDFHKHPQGDGYGMQEEKGVNLAVHEWRGRYIAA